MVDCATSPVALRGTSKIRRLAQTGVGGKTGLGSGIALAKTSLVSISVIFPLVT